MGLPRLFPARYACALHGFGIAGLPLAGSRMAMGRRSAWSTNRVDVCDAGTRQPLAARTYRERHIRGPSDTGRSIRRIPSPSHCSPGSLVRIIHNLPGSYVNRNSFWLLTAFLVSWLAVGLSYWPIPYRQISLPESLLGLSLNVVAVSACLLAVYRVARFRTIILIETASIPAVVFSRVVMDGVKDPTSHNLWPLEIVIALGVGFVSASIGALAGGILAWSVRMIKRSWYGRS
jgi:hypothetical protein